MTEASEYGPGGMYESGPNTEHDRPADPPDPKIMTVYLNHDIVGLKAEHVSIRFQDCDDENYQLLIGRHESKTSPGMVELAIDLMYPDGDCHRMEGITLEMPHAE